MRPAVVLLILTASAATAAPVPKAPLPDPVGRGYLGILFANDGGMGIAEVFPDTAAARAGLQVGDVFVRVGSVEPKERSEMQRLLVSLRPGSLVRVTVRRGAEEKTLVVRLGTRPANLEPVPP